MSQTKENCLQVDVKVSIEKQAKIYQVLRNTMQFRSITFLTGVTIRIKEANVLKLEQNT